MIKKIALSLMTVATLASCAEQQPKMLVLCYSQTGNTKAVAEQIAAQTGADIEMFDITTPYDGDFGATIARCQEEMASGTVPELSPLSVDPTKYDIIFLGFPVWFGTYAPPVASLLKEYDLSGKTIVPFCTFGSGGLEACVDAVKAAVPDADVREGYGVRAARIDAVEDEVATFLVTAGFKEGVIEVLPEYSEQEPVTEEEAAIFEEACSSYQMPLGSPVSFGKRESSAGTDYLFIAQSGENGPQSKIYVTLANDGSAYFTRVAR